MQQGGDDEDKQEQDEAAADRDRIDGEDDNGAAQNPEA